MAKEVSLKELNNFILEEVGILSGQAYAPYIDAYNVTKVMKVKDWLSNKAIKVSKKVLIKEASKRVLDELEDEIEIVLKKYER